MNVKQASVKYIRFLHFIPWISEEAAPSLKQSFKKTIKQCIHFSLCLTRYPNSSDRDISVAVAMKDSIAMKNPPAPHFKQEIIYCVHLEKQLSIDIKTWRCGEEKYYIFKLSVGSRVSCNASFWKKCKAVGLVQPFKVNAKMLAFSKQRHIAFKENTVLLRFLVKEIINNA